MKISTPIKAETELRFFFCFFVKQQPFYCPYGLSRTRENQSINVSNSLELTLTQI